MPSADTIDVNSGAQDLAVWDTNSPTSMVKFSDGSFWVAEIVSGDPQVRKIASDGTQTVLAITDQISPFQNASGVRDLILGTDGTDIWLAMLAHGQATFTDQSCLAHPVPDARVLHLYEPIVGIYAASAPSGLWVDVGPAFYLFGKDEAATGNAPVTFGTLPAILPDGFEPINLQSAFTACASSAQTGFFHVMWGEVGYAGNFNPCDYALGIPSGDYISRLSYSRWTPTGLDTQVDLLSNTENWGTVQTDQGGAPLVADAAGICAAVLKNDTGSPVAFVCQLGSYSVSPVTATQDLILEPIVRMWDMSSPTAGSPSELQNSSGVTPTELDHILISGFDNSFDTNAYLGPTDLLPLQCAAEYVDPLLSDTPVYLIGVAYQSSADSSTNTFILRVPCDGSATFDFLDGSTSAAVGILRNAGLGDFVSETRNVWWPSDSFSGTVKAKMMQYDRICCMCWRADYESPGEVGSLCPRGIDLTDDLISFVSYDNSTGKNHLTQQIILREVNDCGGGLHIWQKF